MNTCETCKYWVTDPNTYYSLTPPDPDSPYSVAAPGETWLEYRTCERIRMPGSEQPHGEYPKAADGRGIVHAPKQMAYVQDGSDYHAELITRGDFGCPLWETP